MYHPSGNPVKPFIVVARQQDSLRLEPSTYPAQHATKADAQQEAERLARQHPNKDFVVFEASTLARDVSIATVSL